MHDNLIYIGQSLHGYSNGHHLLASSAKLSGESKHKMSILSDLSGSGVQNGFREYYTAYFLPKDEKAVLSCTWYAEEMERPGCVWTHSLIFDIETLHIFGNHLNSVINFFQRPIKSDDYIDYSKTIEFSNINSSELLDIDKLKLTYLIWAIWGNDSPAIVSAESSDEFAVELIYLWFLQNKDLREQFSFSTGSFALRQYDNDVVKLQVVPQNIVNSFRNQKECKVLHGINDIKNYPLWVVKATELQLEDGWDNYNLFRRKFGVEYLSECYFVSFMKIYLGTRAELNKLSIVDGLKVIDKTFMSFEKTVVGNKLLDLYLDNELTEWETEDNSAKLLRYLVDNSWISIPQSQLKMIVEKCLSENNIGAKSFIHDLIYGEINEFAKEALSFFAKTIRRDQFAEFTNMDLNICTTFVLLNRSLALSEFLWQQTREFQFEIMKCLKARKNEVAMIDGLPYTILDNSQFNLADEIYYLFENKAICAFLDYLLKVKILANKETDSLKKLCKKHPDICLKRMVSDISKLNSENIILCMELIDQYSINKVYLKVDFWTKVYNKIDSQQLEQYKMNIAFFYFPIILKTREEFPVRIVAFAFEIVHAAVAADKDIAEYEWSRLEKLLPSPGLFESWDKCKRLRKAIRKKGYRPKDFDNEDDSGMDTYLL